MSSAHPSDGSHPENRRVRMEDGFIGEDDAVEPRVPDAVGQANPDDDDTTESSASSAVSEGDAGSEVDSEGNGRASTRSRRSSASRWSMSRRSSPPPELPVSPLLPSRRQSSNAAPLTHEERMTLGMRRSSSRASRTSRTSRLSRASGGGVVSFEDDEGDVSGDASDEGDSEAGDGDLDVDVEPLTLVDRTEGDDVEDQIRADAPVSNGPSRRSSQIAPADIPAAVPSSIAGPTDIPPGVTETSPLLPDSVASPSSPPVDGSTPDGEVADADTLFEQSLMAGAWSAFRRTEEGRSMATGARQLPVEEREIQPPARNEGEDVVARVERSTTPTDSPTETAPTRRGITYCEPAPAPASSLQQDLYNLFIQPKYLTLRCGATAPQRVFTRGCASTLTLFGVSLTLPNSPSHMAAWRTLIPVPMIWHKPAGTQTQWFATKEVPEKVVKLLTSPYGDEGYDMRRVGMREPGGGRDCYVLACSCCGNKLGFYFNNPPEAFKGYHWLFLPSLVTALKEESRDESAPTRKVRPSTRSRQRTDPMEFLMPLDPKDVCPDWVKTENRRHVMTPRMTPRSWDTNGQNNATAGPSMPPARVWPRISYFPRRDLAQDSADDSGREGRRGRSGFAADTARDDRPSQFLSDFRARAESLDRALTESLGAHPPVQPMPATPRLMLSSRTEGENLRASLRQARPRPAGSPLARQARIAPDEMASASDFMTQTARRATGVGNGVEMRQVLIDGRMMDVVVIGESDVQAGPSAGPSGTSGEGGDPTSADDAAADCPPDALEESRSWLENFNATRADLLRSANAWQAIRDAGNDADARAADEDDSDDDWQTRVGDDGLEAVSERSGEDDTHDEEGSEVSEEGTESGEEVNDDGGIPMRGWSMLDVDGQRARSRSRSRSRSRADSPARGRESFSRNTQLRGSLRHASTSRSRSRVRLASPSPTPSATFLRRAEETEKEESRIEAWRYWKELAEEWQNSEPPLLPLVDGRTGSREPGSGLRTQDRTPGVIDPDLLVY